MTDSEGGFEEHVESSIKPCEKAKRWKREKRARGPLSRNHHSCTWSSRETQRGGRKAGQGSKEGRPRTEVWERPGPAEAKHSARKWPTVLPAGTGQDGVSVNQVQKEDPTSFQREKHNQTEQTKSVPYTGSGLGLLCL